ncbi:nodulin MtN3 family protein [Actinidia rufa]|uniref:Nodulin MtN3 family protein n=1 Tax=Actinidia rufa TaxID=165716 RepID=A0A7J0EQG6_9ERIC|nr:nodulin MtN3 family protein [Actinidia rufa]
MPIVSPGIIPVATVNSIGAVFQLTYLTIFIINADKAKQVKMLGLLLAVFAIFGIIAFASVKLFQPPNRQIFVGYLSVISLISMFASPLFVIVPNGIGTGLGIIQLVMYYYYSNAHGRGSREPLLVSYV